VTPLIYALICFHLMDMNQLHRDCYPVSCVWV